MTLGFKGLGLSRHFFLLVAFSLGGGGSRAWAGSV